MTGNALTFDEAQQALAQVMDELPPAIFDGLNGGVVLRPDIVLQPGGLYTLGRYHNEPTGLGRYILIFYGSVLQVYGHRPRAAQRKALRQVLLHELTHHVECLAGVADLEEADARQLEEYRRRREGK